MIMNQIRESNGKGGKKSHWRRVMGGGPEDSARKKGEKAKGLESPPFNKDKRRGSKERPRSRSKKPKGLSRDPKIEAVQGKK